VNEIKAFSSHNEPIFSGEMTDKAIYVGRLNLPFSFFKTATHTDIPDALPYIARL